MIWHIIPEHVLARADQGSFKDVSTRAEILKDFLNDYRRIVVSEDRPDSVLDILGDHRPSHVLVEYSSFPRTLAALRKRWPSSALAVRAHNIEPLQNIANNGLGDLRKAPWVLYGSMRLLAADVSCRQVADAIFPISDWESDHYWKHLPGGARVEWLPYVTPWLNIQEGPGRRPRNVVACLPSSSRNRKSIDLIERFARFAVRSRSVGCDYRFKLTGDLRSWGLDLPSEVETTGMLPDLGAFMNDVLAVAILSPLGYGFKTTIMDAIAAGAFVLLHPTLYRRCPPILRPACIPVADDSMEAVAGAVRALGGDFPLSGINDLMRRQAQEILCRFAGVPPPTSLSCT